MHQANRQVSFGFTAQKFPAGTHICYLYNDERERRHIMAQFVESGLLAGEKVGYLADAPSPEKLDGYLSELGLATPAALKPGQLLLTQAEGTYCPDGTFMPERMIDYWRSLYAQAHDEDFAGVRATGETGWLRKGMPGSERWIEYEAMINLLVEEFPISGVICQYDTNSMDGAALFDVLNVHPMMIMAGQIIHNPYYQPPAAFLDRPAPAA